MKSLLARLLPARAPRPRREVPYRPETGSEGHAAALALVIAFAVSALLLALLLVTGMAAAQGAAAPPLDGAARAAIIDSLSAVMDSIYVFPETAAKMQALLRENLRKGAYDPATTIPDFARRLTDDLRSVSHDGHLAVTPLPPGPPPGAPAPTPAEQQEAELAQRARANFGFESVAHLAGNIGYLDLRSFDDARLGGRTAVAAMNFLGQSDAIIFDLRKNGGGDPSMIQLLTSCLVPGPTHLNDFYIRRGGLTEQFWTPVNVAGPDLSAIPVYVLTSSFTFSGAEEFSYNLKNLKRATIVGETTGGGAHPVRSFPFPALGVMAHVPFGRAVNPVTGTNWEGTGVEPDVKVPAEDALRVAHLAALQVLADQATDPEQKQALAWARAGVEFAGQPASLSGKELRAYEGSFGPRKVWMEEGDLFYQRAPQPPRRLLAAGHDTFFLDGVDFFRVRFNRDGGKVTSLVGMYQDGRVEENPRD